MKVSIIIPVYNASTFIIDCLNSVANQTMANGVECILVDDCGQDDSANKIVDYISQYKGEISYKFLQQSHNQGPSAARNKGIQEAIGEYLFFLDADDLITETCIETLYTIAKSNNSDYVQGTYQGEKKYNKVFILDERKSIKSLLLNYNKIPFTPHNRLVRRQMILDHNLFFNEQIKVREDFLWMTFVAKYVNRFAFIPIETYRRGYNEESLTHKVNREREIQGYRVLIEVMCNNFDPFLIGEQKELALDALLICLRKKYYKNEVDKNNLIDIISKHNNWIENCLLSLYLKTNISKIHHLLLRIYKLHN